MKNVFYGLIFLLFCTYTHAETPPNIILFLVDDMGWMDCGAYGSKYYETPNIDALAKKGMLFTDAYSAHPACSPTRASILTGQYPSRHGIVAALCHRPPFPDGHDYLPEKAPPDRPVILPDSRRYLDPSEYTIAEALRDAGYRTAHMGKWHLGLNQEHWPERHGFDLTFHCAPDPGPPDYFSPYGVYPDGKPSGQHKVGNITDGPPGEHIMDRLASEAEKFIEENREGPFLLHLWSYGVHGPWQAKEEYTRKYAQKTDSRGVQANPVMASMLQSVDECLGRIVAKIEEQGLTDNTIIIFTSDNGGNIHSNTPSHSRPPEQEAILPWLKDYRKFAGYLPPTNNSPLNKGKLSIFEGGVRVPFIVVWPGMVKPGSRSSEMVSSIDLYPTMLGMAGVKPNPDQVIDGISILPVLKEKGKLKRTLLFNYKPETHASIGMPASASVRSGNWKLIRRFETAADYPERLLLFNLKEDIGESMNLAGKYPEKLSEMDALLDDHFLEMGTLLPVPNPAYIDNPVSFKSSDTQLQDLYDSAAYKIKRHLIEYAPGMEVLANSGDYTGLFLENALLNGENYARFDPQYALNNMLAFFIAQRNDGKFPNVISPGYRVKNSNRKPTEFAPFIPEFDSAIANYSGINGICLPYHAWRVYFWTGKDRDYLQQLYLALEKYDEYLWKIRDSNGDGLLELWCFHDSGEDNSARLRERFAPTHWPFDIPPGAQGAPVPDDPEAYKVYWGTHVRHNIPPPESPEEILVPFESMDVNAYSYAARDVLSLISTELNNGKEIYWREKAEEVRKRVMERLWVEDEHACFDIDRKGNRNPELIHNNLRAMYYGLFTQQMADEFIRHHLLNPEEFWTPMPIPSIAVNDPLFENVEGNNWSGSVQALTLSRSLHALEKYGHYAELSLLGEKMFRTFIENDYRFAQQMDPFTGFINGPKPDYNVTMTAACLAYFPRMYGIYPVVDEGKIWWSALPCEGNSFQTSQWRGETLYEMICEKGRVKGFVNGKEIFSSAEGVRIVTDEKGSVVEVVGISPETQELDLVVGKNRIRGRVKPNRVYQVGNRKLKEFASAPFDYPWQPSR